MTANHSAARADAGDNRQSADQPLDPAGLAPPPESISAFTVLWRVALFMGVVPGGIILLVKLFT